MKFGQIVLSGLLGVIVLASVIANGSNWALVAAVTTVGGAAAFVVTKFAQFRPPTIISNGRLLLLYAGVGVVCTPLVSTVMLHPHPAWADVVGAALAGWLLGRIPAVIRHGSSPW